MEISKEKVLELLEGLEWDDDPYNGYIAEIEPYTFLIRNLATLTTSRTKPNFHLFVMRDKRNIKTFDGPEIEEFFNNVGQKIRDKRQLDREQEIKKFEDFVEAEIYRRKRKGMKI